MSRFEPGQLFSGRQARRVEAADIVSDAIAASTESKPVVAARMEITSVELARVTDATSGRAFPLDHALALDERAYRRFLDRLADRAGLAVVELPKAAVAGDELRVLAAGQKESAEAIAHGLASLADGRVCSAEGVAGERECDEAIAALLAIREVFRAARREGVVGLRAVGGGR